MNVTYKMQKDGGIVVGNATLKAQVLSKIEKELFSICRELGGVLISFAIEE